MSDPSRCVLCGGPNECGVAMGTSDCWCFSVKIPPEVLARVPEDQRNQACVCRRCAESAQPGRDATAAAPPAVTGTAGRSS